ncbi:zinc finger protein weckle-like [Anopheles ziemanni]|uniref:zinc finger protein weckle-like n=1 Tax=Anopheles coustani TaxID=139045 RepID=UPI0026586543|nr:zinc finger protein weckle-like [Anopheles coustani]XP_058177038.1 zinc finger protein weckle-like [Anopheles ziemanni]
MRASWKNWCRVCASEAAALKLEAVDVINTIILPTLHVSISDISKDALSICEECCKFVNKLERFKERCEETDRLFIYLSNFNSIEMSTRELKTIRRRYLGLFDLGDGAESNEEEIESDAQHLTTAIEGVMLNEGNTKANNPDYPEEDTFVEFKVEQLETSTINIAPERTASDTEQWEPNEIEYEEDRSADNSDPPSRDEKLEEVEAIATESTAEDQTSGDDLDKNSSKSSDTLSTVRRKEKRKLTEFQCGICLKKFSSRDLLKKHEDSHFPKHNFYFPDNEFTCPICDKKFRRAINVKAHVRLVHDGIKPFICEECGRAFGSKGALKEHYVVHSDDRPFKCPHCPMTFKNQSRLKTHEDVHNETHYICPYCGLQLKTKRTLNMHMLVHSDQKNHRCQYCGKEYKRSKALKTHLILHTGLRPYQCPFCDRTFTNGSNCRSHKKKFHPLELAALEAGGGQKPASNIPKLENLQPKSQNNTEEPELKVEVVELAPIVETNNAKEGTTILNTSLRLKSKKRARYVIALTNMPTS